MFLNRPSVLRIKEAKFEKEMFSFQSISGPIMQLMINNIDTSKSYQKHNIPPKLLKENYDICKSILCSDVNRCMDKGIFPGNLKNADITPVLKSVTVY